MSTTTFEVFPASDVHSQLSSLTQKNPFGCGSILNRQLGLRRCWSLVQFPFCALMLPFFEPHPTARLKNKILTEMIFQKSGAFQAPPSPPPEPRLPAELSGHELEDQRQAPRGLVVQHLSPARRVDSRREDRSVEGRLLGCAQKGLGGDRVLWGSQFCFFWGWGEIILGLV